MPNKIKLPTGFRGSNKEKIGEIEWMGLKMIIPKDYGIFTPIQSWYYPYKGYPLEKAVDMLAVIKGMIPMMLKFVEQSIKHGDILTLWSLKNSWHEIYLYFGKCFNLISVRNPNRYCRPVREIYRIFRIQCGDKHEARKNEETWKNFGFWSNLRTIICNICEFDNAYRYRLQDFLTELNIESLKKHPIKELRRLLDLMVQRENRQHIANKWRRLKLILTLLLIIKPKAKKKIVEILSEVNKTEIAFEDDDWYCISMRSDYNFGGLTREQVVQSKNYEES